MDPVKLNVLFTASCELLMIQDDGEIINSQLVENNRF